VTLRVKTENLVIPISDISVGTVYKNELNSRSTGSFNNGPARQLPSNHICLTLANKLILFSLAKSETEPDAGSMKAPNAE